MHFSNKMYSQFFSNSKNGLVVNSMDGSFVEFNNALIDLVGYTRDELLTMTFWDLVPDEHREAKLEQLSLIKQNGSYGPSEKEYYHKNGYLINALVHSVLITDDDGVDFIFSTLEDISDIKKAQDVLKRAQALGNIGHWYLDLVENKLEWSDETYRIFGLEPQEFDATYEAFVERIYPDDRDAVNSAYANSVEIDEPYEIEHRVIRKDGEIRYVIERCEHSHGKDGQIIGSIGTVLDITDRKINENAMIDAKNKAESASIAKSSFLASMSHELRTPLNAILGFSNRLVDDDSLSEDNKKHLEIINSSGSHLLSIINDILEMSKIEAGEMSVDKSVFNLIKSINTSSQLMSYQVNTKKIECVLNIDESVPEYVITDEVKLKQVLLNIIGNAIKFTESGTIEMSMFATDIKDNQNSKMIHVDVCDTGCGIDTDMLDEIFKPFIQNDGVKKVEGGTGLGLAISKKIMKLLGGTLSVDSKIGEGSVFHISFPVELAGELLIDSISKDKSVKKKQSVDKKPESVELEELPVDIKNAILDAAKKGSRVKIKKELDKIVTTHSNIYKLLSDIIKSYDYEAIIELLGGTDEQS